MEARRHGGEEAGSGRAGGEEAGGEDFGGKAHQSVRGAGADAGFRQDQAGCRGGGEHAAQAPGDVQPGGQEVADAKGREGVCLLGGFLGVGAGGDDQDRSGAGVLDQAGEGVGLGGVERVGAGGVDQDGCARRRLGEGAAEGGGGAGGEQGEAEQAGEGGQLLRAAGASAVRGDDERSRAGKDQAGGQAGDGERLAGAGRAVSISGADGPGACCRGSGPKRSVALRLAARFGPARRAARWWGMAW